MAFSEETRIKALVSCGRRCCICHKFCGNNMEIHHIKAKADGGSDDFENAIPLCFDCHAEVRQYDSKHPKGIKFTEKELIIHRDNWYKKMQHYVPEEEEIKKQEENLFLHRASVGNDITQYLHGAYGISHNEQPETLEQAKLFGEFIQYLSDILDFDFLDDPQESVMTTYNLTESIKELENEGFWVFVGKEDKKLSKSEGHLEEIPIFLVRIVKKDSNEIIKITLEDLLKME